MRLVAVLGYSPRKPEGLHAICEERVRHAERLVQEGDVVLLSGEADLMHGVWNGHEVLLDPHARSTRENAKAVAEAAWKVGADEVVIVTSSWHARRARTLVRAALPDVPVSSSSPSGDVPVTLRAREAACLAVLPLQVIAVRWRRS